MARYSTVDKLTFASDAISALGTGLSASTSNLAAMANSGTAGYFGGGYVSGNVATVDKFAFPGDGRSTLGTGLSAAREGVRGMAN